MVSIAGIDYSMTSPAICIHEGDTWSHENCQFYYIASNKKQVVDKGQFHGIEYPDFIDQIDRYFSLTVWAASIIDKHDVQKIHMEDYAFAAKGRVFHIAENTGLLKYKIWQRKKPLSVYAPTAIKKFATDKGNANKEAMYDSFIAETGIDIRKALDITSSKQWNPLSDIIDAYYVAKLGYFRDKE
jgi:Holliday junction resolvasome RuvABC endonuclease subunit